MQRFMAIGVCIGGLSCAQGTAPVGPEDAGGSSVYPDARTGADAHYSFDAGLPNSDASADPLPGIRVSTEFAEIIGATSVPSEEVMFHEADGRLRIAVPATKTSTVFDIRPWGSFGPTPALWMSTDVDSEERTGTLWAYWPGTSEVRRLAQRASHKLLALNREGDVALIVDDISAASGTIAIASLSLVSASTRAATRRVLRERVDVGTLSPPTEWDACAPSGAVLNDRWVLATVCTATSARVLDLVLFDVEARTSKTLFRNVIPFVAPNEDGSVALFADADVRLYVFELLTQRVIFVGDPSAVRAVGFLKGGPFIYATVSGRLVRVDPPSYGQQVLVASGIAEVEAISDDDSFAVVTQGLSTNREHDLWRVDLGAPSLPELVTLRGSLASSPFSLDSRSIRYFTDVDADGIATAWHKSARGSDPPLKLAERAYSLHNVADPLNILMSVDVRRTRPDRPSLEARLVVQTQEPNGRVRELASRVDPRRIVVFPRGDKVAYFVGDGPNFGLWVSDL